MNSDVSNLKADKENLTTAKQNLETEKANLQTESNQKSETISSQDVQLNTGWYVFGTKKELKEPKKFSLVERFYKAVSTKTISQR